MEIHEIKSQITILEVAERLGIQVNKQGKALCPFHEDKNPSLQFSKEKNIATCFSANCDAGTMDQVSLTEKYLKLSTHEAINKLKEWVGNVPENGKSTAKKKENLESTPPYPKLFKVFTANFQKSKKAKDYLKERGLDIKNLEVGYNGNTPDAKVGTGWPQMKDCIIFPLKGKNEEITGLYGRCLDGRAKVQPAPDGSGKHWYNKNRKGLYPGYPPPTTKELILTESVIDAATLQQYSTAAMPGGSNENAGILACYGTNGFTAEHQQAIQNLPELESITIFFDGDEAGKEGAEKTAELIKKIKPQITIYTIDTPEGEDINSLSLSHEPEVFTHLLENKQPLDSFFFSSETKEKTTSEGLNTDNPQLLTFLRNELLISILGGIRIDILDRLRITLRLELTNKPNPLYSLRHTLDLYHDDQVEKLIRKAAERLEIGTRQLQLTIAELIEALENYRIEKQEAKKPKTPEKRTIPPEREKRAIGFMKRKGYLRELNDLIGQAGVVGEEANRLILWIIYATRKREDPLHVICLGASGTGKTYLQEKVSDLVPEEDKVSGTAISENALYYAQDLNLSHKLFIIEDLDGASNILYALRELQTKRAISKMVTQKDSKGNLKTAIMTVQGPICLTATTTKEKLYEDNANRCLLIYLDGSKQQQEAIMEDQRKRSAGKINKKDQQQTKEFLRDMQALYKPIAVRNLYAEQLRIPETVFKPLRTNSHYLAFIEGITFCNQWQRHRQIDEDTGEAYIETTIEDIELANELMKDVLLAKSDELTKACRDFFERLKHWLKREQKASFYSKEIRKAFRMAPTTTNRHLLNLMRYGYVKAISGNRAKGYEYELEDRDDYNQLTDSVNNALEAALERIKSQETVAQ